MENYRKIDKVGEGTYGKVYMAKDCRNGNTVALKKIQMGADGIPFTAIREIALLKGVSRPNIIRLLDILTSDCSIYLVFEYLEYDLKKYTDQFSEGLPPAMVKNYMRQLLKGIGYCHSRRIIHRDLKPQNLLIDKEGGIKIADFGLSRTVGILSETFTHEVVTLWYRCPEIILGSKFYGFGIDIWSLACIFAEMAHKKVLFKGDSEIDQLFKIFRILGTPDEKSWPCLTSLSHYNVSFPKWLPVNMRGILPHLGKDALDLIQAMLAYDSKSRISAKDALNHKYFKEQIPIPQTAQASYVTIL